MLLFRLECMGYAKARIKIPWKHLTCWNNARFYVFGTILARLSNVPRLMTAIYNSIRF